ncbi:hypothetical protein GCM10011385_18440 [Nitratireductor aestuarii]|uniref:Type III secretion system major needle protein, YscF/MxiH/PrgI family n=1 Tax=Nitratireductor aestuarii TaxID=1735103 RepID=A0A916RQM0_9HYPH|nr:type III secretion system inner rod subunit SctI [Nitratireductor aestuarii]GGA64948.1 hypothetical protein GCM10011385_18440 [Nitratireductor aestuarii]
MGVLPLITPSMGASRVSLAPPVAQAAPVSPNLGSKFALLVQSKMDVPDTSASQAAGRGIQPIDGAGGDDALLRGLERLRSTFDVQEARVNELMSGASTDPDGLITMQFVMMNYSILIDVTSKLAGKAAQGLDTLMKGS